MRSSRTIPHRTIRFPFPYVPSPSPSPSPYLHTQSIASACSFSSTSSSAPSPSPRRFDPSVVEYLACPISKTPLRYDEQRQILIAKFLPTAAGECETVGEQDNKPGTVTIHYPIVDGVPKLLKDEAIVHVVE